jgi:hypothetical protein
MFFKNKKKYSFEESMCFLELLSCKHNSGRNIFYYDEIESLANKIGYEEDFIQQLLNNKNWVVEVGDGAYRI